MNEALLMALLVTLEPLPVIGFILVLSTDGGARNGGGYIAGWVTSLTAIVAATIWLQGGTSFETPVPPAQVALVIQIGAGVSLLGLAGRRRRHPPSPDRPPPGWTTRLQGLGLGTAALVGVMLQPWPLIAAWAADVAKADLSDSQTVVAAVGLGLVSTASLLIMEGYALTDQDRAMASLGRLRAGIEGHRDRAITILLAVAGGWLVLQGVLTLVTAG